MTEPLSALSGLSTSIPAAAIGAATPASAVETGRSAGAALLDALNLGSPVGVPLREVAGTIARALDAGNPVASARLEGATLDFAREAKAFAIGHEAAGPDAVRGALDAALDAGTAQADRLSAIAADTGDRVTTIFEGATAHLRTI